MSTWRGNREQIDRKVSAPSPHPRHISKNKILIFNDAVVVENDELEIANPQFALDLTQAIESIRKISSLDIDRLFCYHGGTVWRRR